MILKRNNGYTLALCKGEAFFKAISKPGNFTLAVKLQYYSIFQTAKILQIMKYY